MAMYIIIVFLLIGLATSAHILKSNYEYYEYTPLKAPISWEQIMGDSLDLAIQSCQREFQWQRWNCETMDFFLRRTSKPTVVDREDVYVTAIATAAILFTITKQCANGVIDGCGCPDSVPTDQCDHDPARALEIYEKQFGNAGKEWGLIGDVQRHNFRVVSKLLQNSLVTQTNVKDSQPKNCIQTLKPFATVSRALRQMYDDAVQLGITSKNLKILWTNIPLDTLTYMKDSLSYCEPIAETSWPGTRGRQCSTSTSESASIEERQSCNNLCRSCGYRVRSQLVRTNRPCLCKFSWNFQLQCETCVRKERQYFCY